MRCRSNYTPGGLSSIDLEGNYIFGNWSNSGVIDPDGEIFAASPPENGDGQWSLEELVIAGTDNGKLNRYVLGFGRDQDGELYVLTSESFRPTGDSGEVFMLVPEGEGETLSEASTAKTSETNMTGNSTQDQMVKDP